VQDSLSLRLPQQTTRGIATQLDPKRVAVNGSMSERTCDERGEVIEDAAARCASFSRQPRYPALTRASDRKLCVPALRRLCLCLCGRVNNGVRQMAICRNSTTTFPRRSHNASANP